MAMHAMFNDGSSCLTCKQSKMKKLVLIDFSMDYACDKYHKQILIDSDINT